MEVGLVFLDVDEVLNTTDYVNALPRRHGLFIPTADDLVEIIDRRHVPHLNLLTDASGASIVLTSTWRLGLLLPDVHRALRSAGVTGDVVGLTPQISRNNEEVRHLEIHAWLRDNRRSGVPFVILDDMEDLGDLTPWLVRTQKNVGLQEAHVGLALRILGDGPRPIV